MQFEKIIEEKSYSDIFKKDEYKISRVVATTYSFDLSLIGLFISLCDDSIIREIEKIEIEKIIIEYFKKNSDKVWIFHQDKEASSPESFLIFAESNELFIPVKPQKGTSFHPKIILIEFKHKDENKNIPYCYRLAISSRNLKLSDNFEVVSVLERCEEEQKISDADLTEASKNKTFPQAIIDYLNDKNQPWKPCFERCINAEVYFAHNNDIQLYKEMNFEEAEEVIIASPFYSKNILDKNNIRFYCPSEGEDEKKFHAKVYAIKRGNCTELWIGSANCTRTGLGYSEPANSECMVKLTYNDLNVYEKIIKLLENKGYKEKTDKHDINDKENAYDLKSYIEKIRLEIEHETEHDKTKEDTFKETFKLEFFKQLRDLPSEIKKDEVKVNLLGLDEDKAHKLNQELNNSTKEISFTFTNIKLNELSALLSFSVNSQWWIIKADEIVKGEDLLDSCVDDKKKEMIKKLAESLELIPSISPGENPYNTSSTSADTPKSRHTNQQADSICIYEKMLRFYADDKDKFKKLIEDRRNTKESFKEKYTEDVLNKVFDIANLLDN